jgi:hypothetical protein
MRRIMLGLSIAVLGATAIGAQVTPVGPGVEMRTFVGAFVPSGTMRNDFKDAAMFGVQAARELNDNVHVLASLGYTDGTNKFMTLSNNRTGIWQYDAGVELNAIEPMGSEWLWRPLVGVGVGGRTYDYRAAGVSTSSCAAAYGNAGMEFQRAAVAIRLDARNYVNCFKSPIDAANATRYDFGFGLGLVYHIR